MLTMTISASLASPAASVTPDARKVRAFGIDTGVRKVVRGTVGAKVASSEVAAQGRPVSARRAELMKTARGQAMAQEARKDLGNALQVHGISKVAALRMAAGLSQKELCAATGILQPHLSRLENGKVKTPELPTLQAMSRELGVSLEVLISAFVTDTSIA